MDLNKSNITRERLEALTFFRVIGVTIFLAGAIVIDIGAISSLTEARSTTLLSIIVGTYLLSIVYAIVIRQLNDVTALAYVQVALDIVITTVLVAVSGGFESIFFFVFHINVVNAAAVVGKRGGFVIAIAASLVTAILAFAAVGGLEQFFPNSEISDQAPSSIWFRALLSSAFAFILAFLSGYLSDRAGAVRTELVEKEYDIQELRALNESILDSMNSGVISVDKDVKVIYFNRTAAEIVGDAMNNAMGKSLRDVIPEMGTQIEGVMTVDFARGDVPRFECEYQRDGAPMYLGYSVSRLSVQGEATGEIIIFQDLTSIRQMERDVRRSERLASVGQLAASIAHEVRNPLASISGSVEMLQETSSTSEDDKTLLRIVNREVSRLDNLITEFLDYARPRDIELVELNVRDIIDEVMALFDQQENPLVVKRGNWDVEVRGEVESLKQVMWNLLNNAKEATEGIEDATIIAESTVHDDRVTISIEDNGPGIPRDVLPHIFEPFFTTKTKGTGLGLSSIYRIIRDHGGDIHAVEPVELTGARLEFVLRRAVK